MNDYRVLLRRDRRLAILGFLEACAQYTSNGDVIQDVLNQSGLPTTHDEAVTELWWLQEQGLVALVDHRDFLVIEATERGVETARGVARHPDVSRPRPKR